MVVNSTINITAIQQIHSISGLFDYVNVASGNILYTLILFSIYIILVVIQMKKGFMEAVTVSSAVCFILSLMLGAFAIINPTLIFVFFILTLIGAFYLYQDGKL
jgi:hypothetical protein